MARSGKKTSRTKQKGKRKPRFSQKQIDRMGLALKEAKYEPEG